MYEHMRGCEKSPRQKRIEELMGNDQGGYPLGSRTQKPHHPEGWDAKREDKSEGSNEKPPPRGTLRSGTHDRSEADK